LESYHTLNAHKAYGRRNELLEELHCKVTHILTLTDNGKFTPITDLVSDAVNTSINPRKLKSVAL
jgi:hypothetical protein